MKFVYEAKGLGIAAVLSIILASITGMVLYYSPLPETLTSSLANVILVLSILTGSGYVSYKRGSKGLIRGLTFGMLCFVAMLILSFMSSENVNTISCLRDLAVAAITGLLGGVLGVSLNNE